MKERKTEIRTGTGNQFQPRLREAVEGESGRTIEGYAVVFGVESRLICDYWENYREVIEKGAITEEELAEMDIKMTLWHNRERLLARSNKGVGTLKLSIDDVGVKYTFEAPDTADGNTALELVKRGDLSGSSFTYWTDEAHNVNYTKSKEDDGSEVIVRHVNKISMIAEMTIASDPAYTQTSVSAREIESTGFKMGDKPQGKQIYHSLKRELDKQKREMSLNNF